MTAKTLFDKVWERHVVVPETPDTPAVLYIDLHLVHEVTSPQAFSVLRSRGLRVHRPDRTLVTMDHSPPTDSAQLIGGVTIAIESAARQIRALEQNCAEFGLELIGLRDARRGIVLAGWVHLTLGLMFGFFNHYHHNLKHAVGKIAWIVILFGLFGQMMVIAGSATVTSTILNDAIFGFMSDSIYPLIGIDISITAVVLILIGVVVLPFAEGPLALTEVIGLFTNLVSYARWAALAVGKGAMALAFNSMLFPLIFESGNVLVIILGALALFVTQMFFVFFLGALSAGIQAIRLNYVEFFLKFFEGGGTDFQPLSYERKYSVATK